MDQENVPIRPHSRRMPKSATKVRSLARTDTFNADETFQLPSPPSSQFNLMDMSFRSMRASSEASRSLLSPPPEEFLQSQRSPAQTPFAPSHLANARGLPSSTSKRKRNTASTSNASSTSSLNSPRHPSQLEATPNPKPRKQSRNTRTPSKQLIDSDTDMESPSTIQRQRLKPHRVASPIYEDGIVEQEPEHTPSPQTTPTRAQRTSPLRHGMKTTPRLSRTASPRTSPSKQRGSYLQSPHSTNPEADYLPPISIEPLDYGTSTKGIRRARRSVTPAVPPYEPPPDVFTPPKLVVLSPQPISRPRASSKPRVSRTRSATPKTEARKSKLAIKIEMPEINLNDPPPPASPTDDPLLLSGPIEVRGSSRSPRAEQVRTPLKPKSNKRVTIVLPDIPPYNPRKSSISPRNYAQEDPQPTPPQRSAIPSDLPASSPLPSSDDDFDDIPGDGLPVIPFNVPDMSTDLSTDGDILPVFNFDPNLGEAPFSDSDDDNEGLPQIDIVPPTKDALMIGEGQGEYTGRWKLLTVPTKNDPPSSATKERMDRWGNPISPFPKKSPTSRPLVLSQEALPVTQTPSPIPDATPRQEFIDLPQVPEIRDEHDHAEVDTLPDEQEPMQPAPAGAFDFDVSFEHDDASVPRDQPVQQDNPADADKGTETNHLDDYVDDGIVPEGAFDFDVSFEQESFEQEVKGLDDSVEYEDDAGVEGLEDASLDREQPEPEQYDWQRRSPSPVIDGPPNDTLALQDADNVLALDDPTMEPELPTAMDSDPPQETPFSTRENQTPPLVPISTGPNPHSSSSEDPNTDYFKPEDDDALMDSFLSDHHGDIEEDEQDPHDLIAEVDDEICLRTGPEPRSEMIVDDMEGDSEGEEDVLGDASLVQITSADPRAAARAAAILKQHDYELYSKLVLNRPKKGSISGASPPPSVQDLARSSRRRSVSVAGIGKSRSRSWSRGLSPMSPRRRTLGGMVGDKVVIPGSPAMTIPELLEEAENGLRAESICATVPRAGSFSMDLDKGVGSVTRDPYATPCPANRKFPLHLPVPQTAGPSRREWDEGDRVWVKDDWKALDSCFTDERLEVGATVALGEDIEGSTEVLADVDDVSLDDVVNRFVEFMGGEEIVDTFGDAWKRDNLLRRAKALQDKQRSGHIPPPTIPAHVRTPSPFAFGRLRAASLEVPDFTPAAARYGTRLDKRSDGTPSRQSSVNFPHIDAPFQNLPPEKPRKLPPSLLAPRYSHLLEEAVAVSQLGSDTSGPSALADEQSYEDEDAHSMSVDQRQYPATPEQPMTMGKRVKGIIFSYLPSLSKTAPQPTNRPKKGASGLPLPPPDLLEKHRKPIVTPARPPPPRTTHPKELVNLHPAPPIQEKVVFPRKEPPKRLVELNPITPPVERVRIPNPRPRTSSGGSVKDLVKNFEHMESQAGKVGGIPPILKRAGIRKENPRPAWRP